MKVKHIINGLRNVIIIGGMSVMSGIFIVGAAQQPSCIQARTALIEPQADVLEWRYKIVGNKKYRRQYNMTKREWIGDWEFVCYL